MAAIRDPAAFAAWKARQQQAQEQNQAAQQMAIMAAMQQQVPMEKPVVQQESTPLGAFQTLWGNGKTGTIGQRESTKHSAGNVHSASYDLWDTERSEGQPGENPKKKNRVGNVFSASQDIWG